MKANELRKSLLASGMDPAEAEVIVKGRIEAGGIEAEETVEKSAAFEELEAMEKAISDVVESWDAEEFDSDELIEDEDDSIAKGTFETEEVDFEDEDYDVTEIIEDFAKAADSIASSVVSRYDGLAKAVTMSSSAVAALAKATWQVQADLDTLAESMLNIQKSLNVPMPPRAVTGTVEAVPAPGETVVETPESNTISLREQVIAKAMTELQNPQVGSERKQTLAKAMADVDAGAHIGHVAKIVGLNKAS
jgi:hypothetical protein